MPNSCSWKLLNCHILLSSLTIWEIRIIALPALSKTTLSELFVLLQSLMSLRPQGGCKMLHLIKSERGLYINWNAPLKWGNVQFISNPNLKMSPGLYIVYQDNATCTCELLYVIMKFSFTLYFLALILRSTEDIFICALLLISLPIIPNNFEAYLVCML